MQKLPEKLTLTEGFYFTDGGSIVLQAESDDGKRHQITLGQHRIFKGYDPNVVPGRLYFDGEGIPARSKEEGELLALLRESDIAAEEENVEAKKPFNAAGPTVIVGDDLKEYYAKLAQGKEATIRHLRKELIEFVMSKKYVKIAKRMAKK